MNKIILLGRLTKTPEIRFSQITQNKVASFTLAVNRKYVKTGEERQTDFINIVAWNQLADFSEKYLQTGIQICISGRLEIRSYENKDGQKRYITEVIAEEIDFADSKKSQIPDTSILSGQPNTLPNLDIDGADEIMSSTDELPF